MAVPQEELQPSLPSKLVANLPYAVAATVVLDYFESFLFLDSATIMVQKEVAERLYAKPGTKDYGALSVWIQSYGPVEVGVVVGPVRSIRPRRWIPPWSPSSLCRGSGIPRTRRPFPPY